MRDLDTGFLWLGFWDGFASLRYFVPVPSGGLHDDLLWVEQNVNLSC